MKHITIWQFPKEVTSELLADASDIVHFVLVLGHRRLDTPLADAAIELREHVARWTLGPLIADMK